MTDREREIAARCEAATPGPWRAVLCEWECDCGRVPLEGCDHDPCSCEHGAVLSGAYVPETKTVEWGDYTDMNDADATFVANSREDVPYLLSETARLRAELEAAQRRADAAVRDIEWYANEFHNDKMHCDFCKHVGEPCWHNNGECNWEWRGPVEKEGV